jgi:sphingomyelin phosphodiesterase
VAKESKLKSAELCSLAFGCRKIKNPIYDWNVTIPNTPKPPITPLKPPKVIFKF